MVTPRVCAVLMLEAAGVTLTVGVVGLFCPPPPPPLLPPPPQASIEEMITNTKTERSILAMGNMTTLSNRHFFEVSKVN
jgi:hypothetical protein